MTPPHTSLIPPLLAALQPGDWPCTRATQADQAVLREVFASTRQIELSLLPPDQVQRDVFIAVQMQAQRRSVAAHYPGAVELLIHHQGQVAGRLWLHEDEVGVRVLDITVLPAFQRQGGARTCLHTLLHLADAMGRATHLHVMIDNPVRHWYARLGFDTQGTAGLYQAMTRLPTVAMEYQHEQA